GIPTPRTWYVHDLGDLDHVDAEPPFALKPAIKEHFIYATKAKAWRADSRHELRARLQQAHGLVGPGEVMIQELIPGDGHQQFADQIGETVAPSRGKPGIRWVRLISDLATGFVMIRDDSLDWRMYLRSLIGAHTEAVFSREDPLPGLTELALIPYLIVKRGF